MPYEAGWVETSHHLGQRPAVWCGRGFYYNTARSSLYVRITVPPLDERTIAKSQRATTDLKVCVMFCDEQLCAVRGNLSMCAMQTREAYPVEATKNCW
jgi:hypothetical protein